MGIVSERQFASWAYGGKRRGHLMNLKHTRIVANQPWLHVPWREIWEYNDLLWLMVRRDLTATYKQTVLGPLWFIIQPLATTIVFTIIFGKVANISTDGVPQFIFYMCGTVFWGYFQGCLNHSATSLISNSNLYAKVYFPRLIIPFSGVFLNLANFALNFVMLVGFYAYFRFTSGSAMALSLYSPLVLLLVLQCALAGLGVGLWVAAVTIRYRDLRFALPLVTQIWMYATPIVYPASLVTSPHWRMLLWLNPMSFVVEASRYLLTGSGTVTWIAGVISVSMTLVLLISGVLIFNKVQRTFVDTI